MHRSLLVLVLLASAGTVAAEPFVPADDAVVLERLPSAADPELRALRERLERQPDDLRLAVGLARRYLEIGRREGDPRWAGYAQAVLAPWWDRPLPPADVLLLRATLRQNRHDFDRALADLTLVLRMDPRHAQAWLTRALILQVRGDYGAAAESCLAFQRLRPSLLATACIAGVTSLSGGAEPAYRLLARAVGAAPPTTPDRSWALTTLAEIAERLGWTDLAERHYRDALAGERDVYLLAAYADFLLDAGRPGEVMELLDGESRADALLLRRALAARRLGLPEAADLVRDLEDRFAAARLRGERTHLGAESRFTLQLLGRPAAALELALENWRLQREPIDARRVLEAARAAGDAAAARPVLDQLAATRLEDARLEPLARRPEEQP